MRPARRQPETPWFDPSLPIKVRQVFLNGQKISSGMLPLEAVIPAEQWLLKLRVEKSDLRGYVRGDRLQLHAALGFLNP